MPEFSFDVVSEYDPAELTNALDQARREAQTRFDFKGAEPEIEHKGDTVTLEASTEDRARALLQVLREKAAKRGLSPKLLKAGDAKSIGKGRGQIEVKLNAGIDDKLAKDLQRRIKDSGAKVQVKIQGDQLRITSSSKDSLQTVIKLLKDAEDIPLPLEFKNYR